MFDPCEICLVKACCKIQHSPQVYKCGCDKYEIFWHINMLKNYSGFGESFVYKNLTIRLKELGVNYEESMRNMPS